MDLGRLTECSGLVSSVGFAGPRETALKLNLVQYGPEIGFASLKQPTAPADVVTLTNTTLLRALNSISGEHGVWLYMACGYKKNRSAIGESRLSIGQFGSGRYNLDTRFAGGVGGHFTGGEWLVDANHNQIAAVTNIGSKPTDALLTLHYDNSQKSYELRQTIAPGDQMWVNLAQLIRNRVADRNGNTLPVDLSSVTYDVKDLTPGGYGLMVNTLGADTSYGFHAVAQSPDCCGYNAYSIIFDPSAIDVFIGQSGTDWIFGTNACNGQVQNIGFDFYTWTTQDTNVAKLTPGKVQGVSAGFTNGSADGDVPTGLGNFCPQDPYQPTLPITVEQPYDLQVNSDIQETVNCGSNPSSLIRQITYNVLDTGGRRMQIPFDLRKNVPTNIVSSCNQHVVQTGATCTSNILYEPQLMGEFSDFLSPGCPSSPNDTPCGFKFANQQWQWCQPSGAQTSIGTIGPVNAENTLINVDGNVLGFGYGTIFLP